MHLTHQNLSTCIILSQFTCKSTYAVINLYKNMIPHFHILNDKHTLPTDHQKSYYLQQGYWSKMWGKIHVLFWSISCDIFNHVYFPCLFIIWIVWTTHCTYFFSLLTLFFWGGEVGWWRKSCKYRTTTDLDQISQNSYTAPCNGFVSHGAVIWGIWVFANYTCGNTGNQSVSTIIACCAAFYACKF